MVNGEISVVPPVLLAFGLPAAVHAAGFGDEATTLEAVALPADAFGTIRASAAVANAAVNARNVLVSDFRQAMQGAGFLAEAVPAAARSYLSDDNQAALGYQSIGAMLGETATATDASTSAGLFGGGLLNMPQQGGLGITDSGR